MTDNAALITRFYEAFSKNDGDAMAACYHDEATFTDPVFQNLNAEEVRGMWRMLTSRSADLKVEFSDIQADGDTGSAHWEAWYTFSQTKRKVHNVIDAKFEFKDGLIVSHVDTFDLYAWTKMAFGMQGTLLGWGPILQSPLRKGAKVSLHKFIEKNG